MKDFSLQLFSLRDIPTLLERMEIAASAGYTGVEFAGYDGIPAAEMKTHLARLGLRGTGTHLSYAALEEDLEGCVRYCVEAGITTAACASCEVADKETALQRAAFFEHCAQRFAEEGIPFAYHNHSHEFVQDGGETLLEIMLRETRVLGFELDVYWAAYADVDPLAFIRRHAGRFPLLHFKEMGEGKANVELGRGRLDFAALAAEGAAQGVRELIVEQEGYTMAPADSVRVDADYMKAL